jgi:hypothetical protein
MIALPLSISTIFILRLGQLADTLFRHLSHH